MTIYLQYVDFHLGDVIINGPQTPREITGNREIIEKPTDE